MCACFGWFAWPQDDLPKIAVTARQGNRQTEFSAFCNIISVPALH